MFDIKLLGGWLLVLLCVLGSFFYLTIAVLFNRQ